MTDLRERAIHEDRRRERQLQERIAREARPVFGTGDLWRTRSCVLIATAAMLRGSLPAGSAVVLADAAYTVPGPHRAMVTRRTWVDLPGGRSWEPVEATVLPTKRHYKLSAPRNLVRYSGPGELTAAIHQADQLPAAPGEFAIRALAPRSPSYQRLGPVCSSLGLSAAEFATRLNRMIAGGVPEVGLQVLGETG